MSSRNLSESVIEASRAAAANTHARLYRRLSSRRWPRVPIPLRLLILMLGLLPAGRPASAEVASPPTPGTPPTFGFEVQADRIAITHRTQPVATFVFRDERILRPYFANLHAPGGPQVTRRHPPVEGVDATDHDTMHPGLWLAFGDMNGADFWRNKARIEHVRFVEPPVAQGGELRFTTECRLHTADDQTLGHLTNRFTLTAHPGAWRLVWDATLAPAGTALVFGDQEEMGFGVRMATALTEKNGGAIVSSAGRRSARDTWGQPADWCDYSGLVEGRPAGVTLMAHPANFRPSWWHNRDYGLMVANPFGREAMKQGAKSAVTVPPGEVLRLRFAAALHAGTGFDPGQAFREFGQPPPLTLAYEAPHWLVIQAPHLPGGGIRINHLEAYCRAGSTDADWVEHTVIPHRTERIALADDRRSLRLRDTLADGVTVEHTIRAGTDEVDFQLTAHNPGATRSEAHWAQPCVRLGAFTGFDDRGSDLDDYLPRCFLFLDGRLVGMSEVRPWAKEARYTPGQTWCPPHVPRTDVNPRPLSPLVPSNGLIGAFSADDRWVFATAWEPYQELFQGVARCLHADFRIGGLGPGETRRIRGKVYLTTNDIPALLARYAADFPEHRTRPPAEGGSADGGPRRETPAGATAASPVRPSDRVIAFYYPWYGNPDVDGRYANWNHPVAVRNEPPRSFPGGDDIGANFYPAAGCYSVNDPAVLRRHMEQLRRAGVGVLCVSWWGKDTFTDRALPAVMAAAERAGLKVNFHLEPSPGRNAATTRDALAYLIARHGASPACHRLPEKGDRPVFFVYDSYLTPAAEWASLLTPGGARTIRGTPDDAVVIGLWVKEREERFMHEGGFDGFYTYFATDGFTYGSTIHNWPRLAEWARAQGKLFVPCVAPGYIDTRIRPWNGVNTRDREAGAYYDRLWTAAVAVAPPLVAITSFNEWHEGTQIEPAVPKQIPGFTYLDYQPLAPEDYLDRTAHWVRRYAP